MSNPNEFFKYATKHAGISSADLERYMRTSVPDIHGFTPQVIEERQMNVVGMDVFQADDGQDHIPGRARQ